MSTVLVLASQCRFCFSNLITDTQTRKLNTRTWRPTFFLPFFLQQPLSRGVVKTLLLPVPLLLHSVGAPSVSATIAQCVLSARYSQDWRLACSWELKKKEKVSIKSYPAAWPRRCQYHALDWPVQEACRALEPHSPRPGLYICIGSLTHALTSAASPAATSAPVFIFFRSLEGISLVERELEWLMWASYEKNWCWKGSRVRWTVFLSSIVTSECMSNADKYIGLGCSERELQKWYYF